MVTDSLECLTKSQNHKWVRERQKFDKKLQKKSRKYQGTVWFMKNCIRRRWFFDRGLVVRSVKLVTRSDVPFIDGH